MVSSMNRYLDVSDEGQNHVVVGAVKIMSCSLTGRNSCCSQRLPEKLEGCQRHSGYKYAKS